MLSLEERALLTDLQDRVIELLVVKDEACHRDDKATADRAQTRIDRLMAECEAIRHTD